VIVRSGLGRPYPNPANPRISVALAVARPGHHRVRVIDAAGRALATIFDEHAAAGTLTLRWDGRDAAGRAAPSGVYFLELTGESRSSRRFTLVR
jgi:flagellar hook assembly protein FlgD